MSNTLRTIVISLVSLASVAGMGSCVARSEARSKAEIAAYHTAELAHIRMQAEYEVKAMQAKYTADSLTAAFFEARHAEYLRTGHE